MGTTQIKEWYNRFKDGRLSVESEPRSGRPSTSKNDAIIDQNRRITIRELVDEVNISFVSAKFVPKLLTFEQKHLRLEITQNMLETVNGDPDFMNTVITGDESWVYGYDPETKRRNYAECDRPSESHTEGGLPAMLSTVAEALGEVCGSPRGLL
ncbi:Uncharacterized protein FKW44_006279 [Caligus rogercresseyi]|uniref:Histone-lysine N-methyltransferase SETMAR n=1 Tax=Caligus rogercresseyi TaxID=217165 RepID=A0A7T8KD33_CALRO|nr:Uncharacterized protein FKW44_006279 [Caligus rogercresseyi]